MVTSGEGKGGEWLLAHISTHCVQDRALGNRVKQRSLPLRGIHSHTEDKK